MGLEVFTGYRSVYPDLPGTIEEFDQSGYFFDSSYLEEITPKEFTEYNLNWKAQMIAERADMVLMADDLGMGTSIIEQAKKQGAEVLNGMGMLLYQAALAFHLWTGYEVDIEKWKLNFK